MPAGHLHNSCADRLTLLPIKCLFATPTRTPTPPQDDLVCLPSKLASSLGSLGPLVLVTRVTNAITLTDPTNLRSTSMDVSLGGWACVWGGVCGGGHVAGGCMWGWACGGRVVCGDMSSGTWGWQVWWEALCGCWGHGACVCLALPQHLSPALTSPHRPLALVRTPSPSPGGQLLAPAVQGHDEQPPAGGVRGTRHRIGQPGGPRVGQQQQQVRHYFGVQAQSALLVAFDVVP